MRSHRTATLGLLVGAALTLAVPARAQLSFTVDLNTSPLIGNAAGPFAIDFQLIDGSSLFPADANNTVTITNFAFGGGSAGAAPTLTGGAAGSLATGVTLTDSDFFNTFVQGFTPGSTLSFHVFLTTDVDAGGIPDQFSFSLLDRSGGQIPTFGLGDLFVSVNIDSPSPVIAAFNSDASHPLPATPTAPGITTGLPRVTITPTQTEVPEPATLVFLTGGLTGLAAGRRRRT